MSASVPTFPGIPTVINGNGAVAHVMSQVCGGVIGYPITPSTEIAEIFEAYRADGGLNVWGAHPFFVETEGEHSAQSGALGAALTGGCYVSNASSSQGVLYAMESHYVTVGKKIGGFVLQVAARVVSKHSLNVMAGHDDVYALLPAGYTILFGSNPQEAADLAAISYRTSALSLIPVANAMDGFATSHVMSEALLPEPDLLRTYLGDPSSRIPAPTLAQEMLYGAKGRVFQLSDYITRKSLAFSAQAADALRAHLEANADHIEADNEGALIEPTLAWVPAALHAAWRRQWINAWSKGTRQLVPALVDPHNPGITGTVQNQPDFQAGAVDHRTHFVSAVPALMRQAMDEYADLTGRRYEPVMSYDCEDADYVMVGLGSITDDVRAVLPYLRAQGLKVGVVSVKALQPFPEAELVAALASAKAVTVLERSDETALTRLVTGALFKARANADAVAGSGAKAAPIAPQYPGIGAMATTPVVTTAIFGLGGHDVQPRHLIAAFEHMASGKNTPLVYLGSQFFGTDSPPSLAALEDRLREAYPETEAMALTTQPNPTGLLPESALRIRFHSVGGYGTVATGKLLTDILAGVLGMHSKSAPKYGSEKSGAATNYYITLSPEPVLFTNAELEDVEVVISPDHQAFVHTNPLKGLVPGGTFILQSDLAAADVWRSLPAYARRTIRDKHIRFLVVDAFTVARKHAPTPELETRMMGIAFIGAVAGHVDRVASGATREAISTKVRAQIVKKFGNKGDAIVAGNMAVIEDGIAATTAIDYDDPTYVAIDKEKSTPTIHMSSLSASMCPTASHPRATNLFDPGYYEDLIARPFREGTIGEAPVLPGVGMFMPVGTGAAKDKGLFRRTAPIFDASACTGCLDCAMVCPDVAIPNTVHELPDLLLAGIAAADATDSARDALRTKVYPLAEAVRASMRADKSATNLAEVVAQCESVVGADTDVAVKAVFDGMVAHLASFPVARTRPFFDSLEKDAPGAGGLFSAVVDPWKCTGCLQCVEVCGAGALTAVDQDGDVLAQLERRFETMTTLPATDKRFTVGSTELDGDIKRMLLDRTAYYATTGGHGACRGCGEVTAIRLVTSMSRAVGEERRVEHAAALEGLIAQLTAKRDALASDQTDRAARIDGILADLDRALYLTESGPSGGGPAPTVVANATGCSSVYASTMPFTPYLDPWVNSLFQDAQPLAAGIYEGLAAHQIVEVKALRKAHLELADEYDPATHDKHLSTLTWRDLTPEELRLMPNVLTIGGDGASYDIGFGAMSRVLASGTPVTMLVLNTGAYSNTGGQASTASFIGQDADLARFGKARDGKQEGRKDLALLASFHPGVFASATSTAMHGHFLTTAMQALAYQDGAAVLDIYTPCGTENGIAEDLSNSRSRLAVESRMSPLFIHDPRKGTTLRERFSLDGNPDIDKKWTASTMEYIGDSGQTELLTTPLTPAEFAMGEVRFKKQFRRLAPDAEATAMAIADYVELTPAQRDGHVPFVYATDADKRLIKVACSAAIVALVEERQRFWQTLQYLAGLTEDRLTSAHQAELAELTARYEAAQTERESSLDQIARAMSSLATASAATVAGGGTRVALSLGSSPAATATAAPASASCADVVAGSTGPVYLDPADEVRCNDCGTCYQELPQLFEKKTALIDGQAHTIATMVPGALQTVQLTPELLKRIDRVKAACDAEIIK